jgi:hypothetical protein
LHDNHQEFLDFVLEGIAKITWWLLSISCAYPQLGIEKTFGNYKPFFRTPIFFNPDSVWQLLNIFYDL